jgi:hypothetical protein
MVRTENLAVILLVLGVWWIALGQYAIEYLDVITSGILMIAISLMLLWNEIKKDYVSKSNENSSGRIKRSEE